MVSLFNINFGGADVFYIPELLIVEQNKIIDIFIDRDKERGQQGGEGAQLGSTVSAHWNSNNLTKHASQTYENVIHQKGNCLVYWVCTIHFVNSSRYRSCKIFKVARW